MTKSIKLTEVQASIYNRLVLKKNKIADLQRELNEQEEQFVNLIMDANTITEKPSTVTVIDGQIVFTFEDKKDV